MAAGATIHKATLSIADLDRHYYAEHDLTLAKHPSETDLRLMLRLALFALHADERLAFTKGITQEDEPDLWQRSFGGEIETWIDLGQPDEKRIRKACGRAEAVYIYPYHEGSARAWWKQAEKTLRRFRNLTVVLLKIEGELEQLAERTMTLQCTIVDGELSLSDDSRSVTLRPEPWKTAMTRS